MMAAAPASTASSSGELGGCSQELFRALLRGDADAARKLLHGGGGGPPALLAPCGFTALHAAVLGGCAAAVPALAAAGAPLDSQLELPFGLSCTAAAPLRQLLDASGVSGVDLAWLRHETTALALAVRGFEMWCAMALLEAGACPAAGGGSGSALCALQHYQPHNANEALIVLAPFLRHGLDPLALVPDEMMQLTTTLVASCHPELAAVLLAHLEAACRAGTLRLHSWSDAVQLLEGAARCDSEGCRKRLLVEAAVHSLERQLQAAHGVVPAPVAERLQELAEHEAAASNLVTLHALLRLPLHVVVAPAPAQHQRTALGRAVLGPRPTACVDALLAAGARPTAADLYTAIDRLAPEAVAALLSRGAPPIDLSQTSWPPDDYDVGWTCPLSRALLHAANYCDLDQVAEEAGEVEWAAQLAAARAALEELEGAGGAAGAERAAIMALFAAPKPKPARPGLREAVQVVEALVAAGYRPAVYRQARLPNFLRPSRNASDAVLAELDPLALLDPQHPQHWQLWSQTPGLKHPEPAFLARLRALLFLARGGAWSPAAHRLWPDSFKAAARALLLACSSRSSAAGSLPPDAMLEVLRQAAHPMSAWL